MRWDWVHADNPKLTWLKKLIAVRRDQRALRIGNFRRVEADLQLVFERQTERALDTVIVVTNPSPEVVTERMMIATADLMDDTPMVDLSGSAEAPPAGTIGAAFMTVTVPPEAALILKPREQQRGGYSRYKRIP